MTTHAIMSGSPSAEGVVITKCGMHGKRGWRDKHGVMTVPNGKEFEVAEGEHNIDCRRCLQSLK